MRSLTRRWSSSSRFAATISKSLYAVWVNAPRPLQSPSAQMPGHVRAQLVVDLDVAALVGRDAGLIKAEIVGVGLPADGEQDVRSRRLRARPSSNRRRTSDPMAARLEADALGIQADVDALRSPGSA